MIKRNELRKYPAALYQVELPGLVSEEQFLTMFKIAKRPNWTAGCWTQGAKVSRLLVMVCNRKQTTRKDLIRDLKPYLNWPDDDKRWDTAVTVLMTVASYGQHDSTGTTRTGTIHRFKSVAPGLAVTAR